MSDAVPIAEGAGLDGAGQSALETPVVNEGPNAVWLLSSGAMLGAENRVSVRGIEMLRAPGATAPAPSGAGEAAVLAARIEAWLMESPSGLLDWGMEAADAGRGTAGAVILGAVIFNAAMLPGWPTREALAQPHQSFADTLSDAHKTLCSASEPPDRATLIGPFALLFWLRRKLMEARVPRPEHMAGLAMLVLNAVLAVRAVPHRDFGDYQRSAD